MITLSPIVLAIFGLIAGLWLALTVITTASAVRRGQAARKVEDDVTALRGLLMVSPMLPLLVDANGRFYPCERLQAWLEIDSVDSLVPGFASLHSLLPGAGQECDEAIARASATGEVFQISLCVGASRRMLKLLGGPAPPDFRAGSVLLWFEDVTETEGQADALRAEVDRLSAAFGALTGLLEATPFPMWHRGPDLRLALVNSAYVHAVEADNALAVIKSGIELIDEGEGRSALSQAAEVLRNGEAITRTLPATIAGERRTMEVVEVPLGGGVAGYAVDVEDREQARADLERFVLAQRDMLDRLSAGVAQFSRDRSLIFVNQPFLRLFSLAMDFLADAPEFDRVIDAMRESGNLPEARDFPEWKEQKRGWFTSGFSASEEEWLLPGGKHLRVVAQPLPDGGLLLIFEDRTEQVQLASARDTLLRVRAATFDNLFEAVGVFASDGRLQLWNNQFMDMWQFEEKQLASHPRVDALVPHIASKLKRPEQAAFVRELVRSATVERKPRNGHVALADGRDFEFATVPLPDGNALFTMLDITDSRKIESALREKNEALEEADRMKTAFVSNMSYELRTPLTSIGGFAEMLSAGYAGELPVTAVEYVAAINDSVKRLGAMIDNVLDLTQSDTGSLLLAEEDVDLQAMCIEAAAAAAKEAKKKGVKVTSDIDPNIGRVIGDRQRLRQAIDNVLKNAIAYSSTGGRVSLKGTGSPRAAEIRVVDKGKGISPANQARVFDRFHRSDVNNVARTGDEAALGLGLPLAKQFIEAHGGSIKLQSKLGMGTTVTIFLPREP